MKPSRFIYVTYIRTTPDKLWDALTKPEFTRAYWHGVRHECDWQVGSDWKLTFPDGRVADAGRVLEVDRPRRLVLEWRHELMPELRAEGFSRCAFEITADAEIARLAVTHEIDLEGSKLIEAVTTGWPMILSSLKSLLETGQALGPSADTAA